MHLQFMQLTRPKPLEDRLSPVEACLHLAIGLFVSDEATLGQAANTAGLSQSAFLKELGMRHIAVHYGKDEFADDLQAVEDLASR